ncbi:Hypothetical predicted protein [Pelobates cultripes]|uniref:Uncharacterized protein n=1 Tax=Pelobates cultripes TaxID=61616 RepID=A0AAD1RHV7_PELCU|nr:Hypothetical predicted protein [Pelobates cultripes]
MESKQIDKIRTPMGLITGQCPRSHRRGIPEILHGIVQLSLHYDPTNRSSITNFLETLELPKLSQTMIEAEVTIEEMAVALAAFKHNKSLGPDGYTALYYK